MIVINSTLKKSLILKIQRKRYITWKHEKTIYFNKRKVKATSYLEKVRAFYVMWVKKQFDSSHSLTMFLSVLSFWLNEVHEDEGQTEIPTRSHIKSISNYRRTEKQRKQGTRTESMCFHFTSAQFNSQLFKHLEGNENKTLSDCQSHFHHIYIFERKFTHSFVPLADFSGHTCW